MKKLELKHLAAYMPYGLKIAFNEFLSDNLKIVELKSLAMYGVNPNFGLKPFDEVKPILRPISDLTPEMIDIGGPVYLHIFIERVKRLEVKYCNMQLLFENHFDVFGLIEQGLAIDINTLK